MPNRSDFRIILDNRKAGDPTPKTVLYSYHVAHIGDDKYQYVTKDESKRTTLTDSESDALKFKSPEEIERFVESAIESGAFGG